MLVRSSYNIVGKALMFVSLAASSGAAWADTIVNRCSVDDTRLISASDLGRAIAAGGHITFNCPAGTVIKITVTHRIRTSTTIDGGGSVVLDAGGKVSMFSIAKPATVLSLKNITLRRGQSKPGQPTLHRNGFGGIVWGQGTLEIANVNIQNTTNPIVLTAGSVRIADTEFSDDLGTEILAPTIELTRVRDHGAGVQPLRNSGGTVNIKDSQFVGVGSSNVDKCRLNIMGSLFSGSTSTALISGCDTSISGRNFSNNHGHDGGALFITKNALTVKMQGVRFSGNAADAAGGAVAFEASSGTNQQIYLGDVIFEGNRATDGGAISLGTSIENDLKLVGQALIFSSNRAVRSGGAIDGTNAQILISRALFVGNSSGRSGGAISLLTYSLRPTTIANSIFTHNGSPVGSTMIGSTTSMINVTIANSEGGPSLSAFWPTPNPDRIIKFRNVAMVDNAFPVCDNSGGNNLGEPMFGDSGNNLQFPSSGCPPTIPVANPKFDAMYIPGIDGAASGKGDLATCTTVPVNGVDIYGRHRPQGKACSIGAVEGDIEDAIEQSNPRFRNLPALPKDKTCQCDSIGKGPVLNPGPSKSSVPPLTAPPLLQFNPR